MKTLRPILAATIWLFAQTGSQAYDPTKVDGIVTVSVDRSEPVWKVVVSNTSDQELTYEMMGKVPRGLGIELWNDEVGSRIHAEDLAKFLNIDGFPADLRKLEPKASVTFLLDPKSMSSTDSKKLEEWKKIERMGYYDCRVFFGIYASRLISVSPKK